MTTQLKDLVAALRSGDLQSPLGKFESEWLECKEALYPTLQDREKLELAKDVSSFANAGGGLILLGYDTEKDPTHGTEKISDLKAVKLKNFDTDQFRSIVSDWTYPPISNLDIFTLEDPDRPAFGVVAILVPEVDSADAPVLVKSSVLGSKKVQTLFGIYERRGDRTSHHNIERLHSLLRSGRNFDEKVSAEFRALQTLLQARVKVSSAGAGPPPGPSSFLTAEERDERIRQLVAAAGLEDAPQFILVGNAGAKMDLVGIFSRQSGQLGSFIDHPDKLRDSGFDISIDNRSQIVGGDRRRAAFPRWGALEAHRDGTLIFVAPGGPERLCWASRANEYRINQVALIEMVYLFCLLLSALYKGNLDARNAVRLQVIMRNLAAEDRPLPGLRGGSAFQVFSPVGRAPSGSLEVPVELRFNGDDFPERLAYLAVAEVYRLFGLEDENIPYVSDFRMGKGIDRKKILDPKP